MPMSFTDLIAPKGTAGSIRNWVNYDPLPVEDLIADAESLIWSQLRVREMRTLADVTVALNTASVALPARFLDPIEVVDKVTGARLTHEHEAALLRMIARDSTGALVAGEACRFAIYGEAINLDVKVARATTLQVMFYQRPAPLGFGNAVNWLTERHPRVLRSTILAMAADFRQDDSNYQRWMGQATALIQAANAESDMSRRGSYGEG